MGFEFEGEKLVLLLLLGMQGFGNQCQDWLERGRFQTPMNMHPWKLYLFSVGLDLDFFNELSKLPYFFWILQQ